MSTVSIIGCGYTGRRLSTRWVGMGAHVRGFATQAASLRGIATTGAVPCALDLDAQRPAVTECNADLVYYCVPPPSQGERDLRLERFLECLHGRPERIVYLSTTGVYGDRGGGRVDEDTPTAPKTARAIRRVAAESYLQAWADAQSISWCILRVPGIYGPDRLPLDRLRQAQPTIAEDEATPSNRIHVEDLVTVAVAAARAPHAHRRLYNVTDGSDESSTAYLQRVARIANLPPPPQVSRDEAQRTFTASSWSFLNESRRVDNRRMLEELGIALRYGDLDAGIRASL